MFLSRGIFGRTNSVYYDADFYGHYIGSNSIDGTVLGKRRGRERLKKYWEWGFVSGVLWHLFLVRERYFFPEPLMRIYTSEPAVIAEGVKYLQK